MMQSICFFVFVGFNRTETKIKTSDGKVWNEEDFHNFSREIYRDMSHNFPGKCALGHQISLHFVFAGFYITGYMLAFSFFFCFVFFLSQRGFNMELNSSWTSLGVFVFQGFDQEHILKPNMSNVHSFKSLNL